MRPPTPYPGDTRLTGHPSFRHSGPVDAADLYCLPPEDFTATRDAAARAAKAGGDAEAARALKALRKPSVAAWLVNVLVAREPGLLEQLLELGPALAQAQTAGEGDALRELGARRRALVGAVVDRAVALADRSVTAAVRDEVAGTLDAGLSDPASAAAVRSGRLVRALSYAGFGGVDLDGAVASPARLTSPKEPVARVVAAEAAALEAAGALDDAVRSCERWTAQADAAEQEAEQARLGVEQARAALQQAEQDQVEQTARATAVRREADVAVEAVRAAQQREEQARRTLDRIRRKG